MSDPISTESWVEAPYDATDEQVETAMFHADAFVRRNNRDWSDPDVFRVAYHAAMCWAIDAGATDEEKAADAAERPDE